jgi:hypothetical protein
MKRSHPFRVLALAAGLAALACPGAPLAAQAGASAGDAAPDNALGARAIAVFPLDAPEGSLRPEHAFARFTVPDMLRQGLAETGGYACPDAAAVSEALREWPPAAGQDTPASGSAWLPAARALEADHFIWGYLVSTGESLGVFIFLADSASGQTVLSAWRTLASDQSIFDAAAAFAGEFSDRIRDAVPLRREVVYIDRPAETEPRHPIEDIPIPLPRNSLAAGAEFRFFLPPFSSWLEPAIRPVVNLQLGLSDPALFHLGLSLAASPLTQKGNSLFGSAGASSVSVVHASMLLDAAFSLPLAETLQFETAVQAGVALIAGSVSPRFISYVRPEAGLLAGMVWRPLPWFALSAALRAAVVPWAWEDNVMVDLSPRLVLRFLF